MRRAPALLLSAAALMLFAVNSADAQSRQKWSIQGSGLFVSAFGDAYEGLDSGMGFEAQVRFTPSAWSFGLGYQASMHSIDLEDLGSEDVTLAGAFFEPRYVIDVGRDSYAPYVSARLAVLSQSIDVEGISASATGTQLNAGGGFLFRLSPRVNLDLGATIGMINFEDVEVTVPGEGTFKVEGTSGSGQNLVLRAGLAIGLGR